MWCDNLNFKYSPHKRQFKLDRWILRKYEKSFPLSLFIKELDKEGIVFRMLGTYFSSEPYASLPDNVIVVIDHETSNSELYFEDVEEDATSFYDYKLFAIGSSTIKHTYKTYL